MARERHMVHPCFAIIVGARARQFVTGIPPCAVSLPRARRLRPLARAVTPQRCARYSLCTMHSTRVLPSPFEFEPQPPSVLLLLPVSARPRPREWSDLAPQPPFCNQFQLGGSSCADSVYAHPEQIPAGVRFVRSARCCPPASTCLLPRDVFPTRSAESERAKEALQDKDASRNGRSEGRARVRFAAHHWPRAL